MKKIFTAAAAALVIASCTSDLSSLNVNSKAPEQVPAGALIANATVSLDGLPHERERQLEQLHPVVSALDADDLHG